MTSRSGPEQCWAHPFRCNGAAAGERKTLVRVGILAVAAGRAGVWLGSGLVLNPTSKYPGQLIRKNNRKYSPACCLNSVSTQVHRFLGWGTVRAASAEDFRSSNRGGGYGCDLASVVL